MPGGETKYFTAFIKVTYGALRAFITIHTGLFTAHDRGLIQSICQIYPRNLKNRLEIPSIENCDITQLDAARGFSFLEFFFGGGG